MRIWAATHKTAVFITHDISVAILLGDRVGVMRAGPGGIRVPKFIRVAMDRLDVLLTSPRQVLQRLTS